MTGARTPTPPDTVEQYTQRRFGDAPSPGLATNARSSSTARTVTLARRRNHGPFRVVRANPLNVVAANYGVEFVTAAAPSANGMSTSQIWRNPSV